jgi:Ni/Fe-hydrogenase subunit HybB-like protein
MEVPAMADYKQISDDVMQVLEPPGRAYKVAVVLLAVGVAILFTTWIYQIRTGMGVAGINQPVGWGTYIGNFVFWVGIAHSGTLISAILFLVRAKWRTSVSRSAEAMTIFAVMTAGLFPLIHLGRFWVFYYILPYPSQRQLWPNFTSALVWDVCAVGTYFTVSSIFFYVGLIPDLAAARDHQLRIAPNGWRAKLYSRMALGWYGTLDEWRHHGRSYLFFAALATPLVVSVHSVVSWDFAMGLLPGWHETIFAPYFVAGAIHSGLAMVLTLLIPLRKLVRLERLIKVEHFEAIALTMIVTTLIVGYAYVVEPFMAWYSGDKFDQQFAWWRFTGSIGWVYLIIVPCNVFIPLLFVFKKVRTSLWALFAIGIFVNIGMWFERVWIVFSATAHDFLPHNWGSYFPTWVEFTILGGSFSFFFFWFFVFSRTLPVVPMSDVKTELGDEEVTRAYKRGTLAPRPGRQTGILASYVSVEGFVSAVEKARGVASDGIETFAPMRVKKAEAVLGRGRSPVWAWTLVGAITGCLSGFALAIYAASLNSLVVGGKPVVAIIPFCIVGFEGAILAGAIFNLIGMVFHAGLGRRWVPPAGYIDRFSIDRMGIFVPCPPDRLDLVKKAVAATEPEEVYVVE